MKLGLLISGRSHEDIARRLEQARDAGFSLCQINFLQTGFDRADLVAIADAMAEYEIRPVALGCYVNPMRPGDPSLMGVRRADLDLLLHSLDMIGARRIVFWSGTHSDRLFEENEENASEFSLATLRGFVTDVVQQTRARHYYLVIEPWKTHVLDNEKTVTRFHEMLPAVVAEHVRYVLDAPNLMTPERYDNRPVAIEAICRTVGPLAGVVHLKDCIMPPDGAESLAAPGKGKLDYDAYVTAIFRHAAPDAPAVVKNVPPEEAAEMRDYLLRLTERWELA